MITFTRRSLALLPALGPLLSPALARGRAQSGRGRFQIARPDQIVGVEPGRRAKFGAGRRSTKEGLYVQMVKWLAGHHFSHPHFHPHDRFITVLKGTWWVGTGTKYDPDGTVPMPAGTFVTHFGQQVHFDGAKDEDAVLLIVGEGPGTSTPAEAK